MNHRIEIMNSGLSEKEFHGNEFKRQATIVLEFMKKNSFRLFYDSLIKEQSFSKGLRVIDSKVSADTVREHLSERERILLIRDVINDIYEGQLSCDLDANGVDLVVNEGKERWCIRYNSLGHITIWEDKS